MGTQEGCHLPAGLGPSPGLTCGPAAAGAGRLCGSRVSVPHLFAELNTTQTELNRAPGQWSVRTRVKGMLSQVKTPTF